MVFFGNPEQDLSIALSNFLDDRNEVRNSAYHFIQTLKDENEFLLIELLCNFLGNSGNISKDRSLAAIFLYRCLKKRTLEDQKAFNKLWYQQSFDFREKLRLVTFQGMDSFDDSNNLTLLCSQVLGSLVAIEFISQGLRDQANIQTHFSDVLSDIIQIAISNNQTELRISAFEAILSFAQFSLELSPNCAKEQQFLRLVPYLFDCLIQTMSDYSNNLTQIKAADVMLNSMLLFRRHFSFNGPRECFVEVILQFMGSEEINICIKGYSIIREFIDNFYPYIADFIDIFFDRTWADLYSNDTERQIEACYFWQTIGDVEGDIKFPERRANKKRIQEFDQCLGFAERVFGELFSPLVELIGSTPITETEANTALDRTPPHAAFTCLSAVSIAADTIALNPIFDFVKININHEDWRLRYTSALLLNASTQLASFETEIENILIAFDLFVGCVDDQVPRIIEVAMWSLGRMIERIPELVTDDVRFERLSLAVSSKLHLSSELTLRGCWLFNRVFNVFAPSDETSILAQNFESLSDLLLTAADAFNAVESIDAAYGALNKLIEKTPSTLVEAYSSFLEKTIDRLGQLVEKSQKEFPKDDSVHKMIGLCSFIQAITMNIGEVIKPIADKLISMLMAALSIGEGILMCEVFPALGAITRAIGPLFEPYLPDFIPYLKSMLEDIGNFQFAAVFVSDLYSALPSFAEETTDYFVNILFSYLNNEMLSNEARINTFSALTEIAKHLGEGSLLWIERFLELFEKESRSVLSAEGGFKFDQTYQKNFTLAILNCYQTMVPIYSQVERGDKKVRNFFHIFDKILKYGKSDEEILMESMVLIKLITFAFGRKMNVYTNKPTVKNLIDIAKKSENEALSDEANTVAETINSC